MDDIPSKTCRRMSIGRLGLFTLLFSGVAVLLFLIAALLTDGDLPRTPLEWFVSIAGAVIVWPVVAASRLLHLESQFILWPLWLASGLFWAFLVELLFFRRQHGA